MGEHRADKRRESLLFPRFLDPVAEIISLDQKIFKLLLRHLPTVFENLELSRIVHDVRDSEMDELSC